MSKELHIAQPIKIDIYDAPHFPLRGNGDLVVLTDQGPARWDEKYQAWVLIPAASEERA